MAIDSWKRPRAAPVKKCPPPQSGHILQSASDTLTETLGPCLLKGYFARRCARCTCLTIAPTRYRAPRTSDTLVRPPVLTRTEGSVSHKGVSRGGGRHSPDHSCQLRSPDMRPQDLGIARNYHCGRKRYIINSETFSTCNQYVKFTFINSQEFHAFVGVSRGNTIRGNRTERFWEGNLPLRGSLRGSLRGRVSEVFRGFERFSEGLRGFWRFSEVFQRPSQRPSQSPFSSQSCGSCCP